MVYVSLLKGKVFRLFLSFIVSLMLYPVVGYSAVFNVTNEDELRQALSIAESNGEDDSINVKAGLYRTFGEPFTFETDEDFSLTIEGEGAGISTLDGDGLSRVLAIESNNENFQLSVTIRGVTVQNGFSEDKGGPFTEDQNGGGLIILKAGLVTIEDCDFTSNFNERGDGGALAIVGEVFSDKGLESLTIINNEFSNNSADGSGGGAYVFAPSNVSTIVNISNNRFISNSSLKVIPSTCIHKCK